MRVVKLTISDKTIRPAMQAASVRARLAEVAEEGKAAVEQLAAAEGIEGEVWTESGTRPKGRPYSRFSSDMTDQEFGTQTVDKKRLMAQAAEQISGQSSTSKGES